MLTSLRTTSIALGAMCLGLLGCSSLEETTRREERVRSSGTDTSLDPSLLEAYATDHPDALGPSLALARRLATDGRHADADATLLRFDDDENDVRILTWRASLAPDPVTRESLARAAINIDATNQSSYPLKARSFFQLGSALADQGRWTDAAEAFQSAANSDSSQSGAWWMLAVAQSQTGKYSEAALSCMIAGNRAWTFEAGDPEWVFRFLSDLYEACDAEPAAVARWRSKAAVRPGATQPRPYPAIPKPPLPVDLPAPFDEWVNLGLLLQDSEEAPPLVLKVTPHSVASDAGVQAGDRLLRVNDTTLASFQAAFEFSQVPTSEETWRITVTREGHELELTGRVTTTAEGGSAFDDHISAGLAHERQDQVAQAAEQFALAYDTISDYNAELLHRWAIYRTLVGGFADAERVLTPWLNACPHNDYLLFTLAHVHAIAANNPPQGASPFALRAKAVDFAQRALAEAPDNGFYVAFLAFITDSEPQEINYWGTLVKGFKSRALECSMALGHGGWAQLELARWLDSTESSLRAAEKSRRQALWRGAILGAAVGSMMGTGSGGGGFGSNPWRDYGYEANAIYGVDSSRSQMIFGY